MSLETPQPIDRDPLVPFDRPPLTCAAGELLLDVSACAVCRTDLQLCSGDLAARRLPIVPGHQIVGRVAQVGTGSVGFKPGDHVGVGWLASTCGVCAACTSGRE